MIKGATRRDRSVARERWVAGFIALMLIIAVLVAGVAMAIDAFTSSSTVLAELPTAVDAAAQERLWPLTMEYMVVYGPLAGGDVNRGVGRWRFSGDSWSDWEHELLTGPAAGECIRRRPDATMIGFNGCEGQLHSEGGEDPGQAGGPSFWVRPGA